ncbi:MAG TPA: GMC family oxidoreductase [Candidatus Angelobacter sp.]|nr:GMC family oxidoreductase [Candidatus Angelobacter sp.]
MKLETFDAIVVGSGIAGGAAAQQLCQAGLRVLVLESGGTVPHEGNEKQTFSNITDYQVQKRCYAFSARTSNCFSNDAENPYATDPNSPFTWIRARIVGGRSLLWAGHCYRMGDEDFTAALQDGIGEEWPIRYQEIAPYYDEAERLLQVRDETSDSYSAQIRNLTLAADRLQKASGAGLKLAPTRISHNLSKSGTPCIHCGSTSAACVRLVTSSGSTLAAAFSTGRLTLWTHAQVHTVLVNSRKKATGVAGIRTANGEHFEAHARVIFLCASTLESTRILLNSTSNQFPNGLGNSSGVLGRYLMDHVSGIIVTAIFKDGGALPPENHRAGMFYIPRWQNLRGDRSPSFLRGYGYQGFIVRADHDLLPCGRTNKNPLMQKMMQKLADRDKRTTVRLVAFGEMLPTPENYVEIDKNGTKDSLGVPVLKISCRLGENELAMASDMVSCAANYLEAAGGQIIDVQKIPWEPGLAIHEAGTCRMGNTPQTSVLNRFNQCHEIPNLFVTDASCFPSVGTQNPALTIMALTIRACRYAMDQLRHGAI